MLLLVRNWKVESLGLVLNLSGMRTVSCVHMGVEWLPVWAWQRVVYLAISCVSVRARLLRFVSRKCLNRDISMPRRCL